MSPTLTCKNCGRRIRYSPHDVNYIHVDPPVGAPNWFFCGDRAPGQYADPDEASRRKLLRIAELRHELQALEHEEIFW